MNNILIHIPHSSYLIPEKYKDIFFLKEDDLRQEQIKMSDSYTDELFNVKAIKKHIFPISRLVCDVERFRDENDEEMAKQGMWVCYTKTSDCMDRGNQVENELINQQNETEEKITYRDIKNNIAKFEIQEKKILEKFLGMDSGYVLNFSNRTFSDFFVENFKINIYDDKYADRGESKAKRLRTFWEKESNSLVADSIEKMIEWWESDSLINEEEITNNQKVLAEKCKEIANNLRNRNIDSVIKEEVEFLNKKFDSANIKSLNLSTTMENVVQQRLDEIKKCLDNNIALGAIFLIGSTLEGLLIDIAKWNPEKFNKANSAPKDSDGNIKKFKDWSLNSLIDVAYETDFIGLDVKKFSHNLRDFRNYIHPEEQITQNLKQDKNTALIAYNVLLAAIEDLNK